VVSLIVRVHQHARRREVTNAQYQEFVDQGGYRKQEYWKEKFVKEGRELSWEQAMELFRDPTGRPGPFTWDAGHYPQGQANYPVTGVSWYEAAAYAAFAGKSLPVILQWFKASPADLAPYSALASNFGGKGPAPVGTLLGVGPHGTFDMAGNAREWIWTESEGSRFILGGAWGTQPYQSFDPELLPPFDRSPMNGFRTVKNKGALSAEAAAPLIVHSRDFLKEKPVSDDVYQAYKGMYAYDKKPLDAKSGGIVEDTPDWTKEKITIDAGYEGQRLDMYLFLPKNVYPPYETVLFFPSARVELLRESRSLGDMQFVDYVIKSGRALLYPIYNGTYERARRNQARVGAIDDLQLAIQQSKEVRRGLDYLESRPDIEASKISYLGVSMGTAYGVIFTALEERFKAIVFLDGGFFLGPAARGRDQLDFAPRVTKPVLMVNGKYDFSFSPERSQEPLFRILGTPAADKRRVLLDTPHDVSEQKDILAKEVLAWLDKYLGRVN
jgi:eukaryotic-like serine/threonine-protein kinase